MLYALCTLAAAALVALDQWVKWWTMNNIGCNQPIPFIPHILDLNHIHNTGGAWSILNEHTWLLTVVSTAVTAVLLVLIARRKEVTHPFGVATLFLITAGAVGNLIDRIRLGYVVDMFDVAFMDFPVFNVADICVTVGAAALFVYAIFLYDRLEGKGETAHDQPPADG